MRRHCGILGGCAVVYAAAGDERAADVGKFRGVRVTVPENPRYKRRMSAEMGESADEETIQRWVTRVYEWINGQAGDDAAKRMSREAVARLVREYGLGHLKRGFAALQRRENIENPAGWLVTFMRSEWKWSQEAAAGVGAAMAVKFRWFLTQRRKAAKVFCAPAGHKIGLTWRG